MIPIQTEVARLQNTLANELLRFVPELFLIAGICLTLFLKLFRGSARIHVVQFAIPLVIAAFAIALSDWMATDIFRGLLRLDKFANFFRAFILLSAVLVLLLSRLTRLPDADDSADFVALVLGATLGMMLMVSANHLLTIFLAIEMASLPSYVLAGFLKGKSRSSEAALKYVVYGAAASGILLFGISLLAGRFGTGSLPLLVTRLSIEHYAMPFDLPLAAALLMIFIGLGFKLAIVPFQFWLPDVFTGAAAEVGAILAVASKAAAIGLTIRLVLSLFTNFPIFHFRESIGIVLGTAAILTATFGNVAALAQNNLKRILAYSTIAHAGIMVLGVACMNVNAASAVLYYLIGYLPMTIGAFAVVAFLRNSTGSEELSAARGLLARSPVLAISMAVFLFSLLGMPPLGGFAGKFQVFSAVYSTGLQHTLGGHPWLGNFFFIMMGLGILNSVISAGYYLKVLKAIGLDDPEPDVAFAPNGMGERLFVVALAIATIAVGIAWDPINSHTWWAASGIDR